MPFRASVYLVSTLNFDLSGTLVRLWGTIEINTEADALFVLDSGRPLQLPDGAVATSRIQNPFGMTGVVLDKLSARARLRKRPSDGGVDADITLTATASFPVLPAIALAGALVFVGTTPRLAIVTLDTARPISLTDLLRIIGGAPGWAQEVTDQFAFGSGSMYYLAGGSEFTYAPDPGHVLVCKPGYHLDCTVRVFEQYDFPVALAVDGSVFDFTASAPALELGVIRLSAALAISTRAQDKHLRFAITAAIFGVALPSVQVEYHGSQGFSGTATLGGVTLTLTYEPTRLAFTGSVAASQLSIGFVWTRDHLVLESLNGLSVTTLDLAAQFADVLNQLQGGCESVVQGWFNSVAQTKLTPRLAGAPSLDGSHYRVPLALTYEILVAGSTLTSAEIPFDAILSAPGSVAGIPAAVVDSIAASAGVIAAQILANPNTYKVLLVEAGKRAGAKALASFLCRALLQGLKDLARALADAAANVVAETLADAVRLAAMLASVALLDVPDLINSFLDALQSVWNWLTGHNDDEKQQAEAKLDEKRQKISDTMAQIWTRINAARAKIRISSLGVAIDEAGNYRADWTPAELSSLDLGSGVTLEYRLVLLTGEPGDATGSPLRGDHARVFPGGTTQLQMPMSQIPSQDPFRLNASVAAVVKGASFSDAEGDFQRAIDQLHGASGRAVDDLRATLQAELAKLQDCRQNGIIADPVYAHLAPSTLLVGYSRIGSTTLITKVPG